MSFRDLLTILVGLLVLACVASFLVWLGTSTGPQPEGGGSSLLAPQEAYACIQQPTFTRTPTNTILPTRTFTPTLTPLPTANKFVDVNRTGGNHNGNSWDNAYTSLIQGITSSSSGGVLYVAEGTYTSNYTIDKALTIIGGFRVNHADYTARWDPLHFLTRITPTDHGDPAVSIGYNNVTLNGFVFGNAGTLDAGAAIQCPNHTGLKVYNSTFENCAATSQGAAAWLQYSSGFLFEGCRFRKNSIPGIGGAIMILNCGTGNVIRRCSFEENAATAGSGGAVYCSGSSVDFTNCLFTKNTATNQGSALYFTGSGTCNLNHCTLSKNGTSGGSMVAVYQDDPSVLYIKNSIIYWNHHSSETQVTYEATGLDPVSYSCVQGSLDGFTNANNINSDPLFYRPEFDWHLRPDSPCKNTADPNSTVTQDLEGNLRDNGFGTPLDFDMGCYEWPDPKFFGAYDMVLGYMFDFRVMPGFPEDTPQPWWYSPERLKQLPGILNDMGVRNIEVWLPWFMFFPMPGSDTQPATTIPASIWNADGDYNGAGLGLGTTPTPSDWTVELSNPFDNWQGGPTWTGSDISKKSYHPMANLGYTKGLLKRWAESIHAFLWNLQQHGIEVSAVITTPPVWFSNDQTPTPGPSPTPAGAELPGVNAAYKDFGSVYGLQDSQQKDLRFLMTIYQRKLEEGMFQIDETDPNHPHQMWRIAVKEIEKQFPFIDHYTTLDEADIKHKRPAMYWKLILAMKEALLECGGDNNVYIDMTFQLGDREKPTETPMPLGATLGDAWPHEFLDYLIDSAIRPPVGPCTPTPTSGGPTPNPTERVGNFLKVVSDIAQNISVSIGEEDNFVRMNPSNSAKRIINRSHYMTSHLYHGIPVYDYVGYWIGQFSMYRSHNKEYNFARYDPLFTQFSDQVDLLNQSQYIGESISDLLEEPSISRIRYGSMIDLYGKNAYSFDDSGVFGFHFGMDLKANEADTITYSARSTNWVHPLTGATRTNLFDYYYSNKIYHHPGFYTWKAFTMGKTTIPEVARITSVQILRDYQVSDRIVRSDWTDHQANVNLSPAITAGSATLLIDGIAVSNNTAVIGNPINFSFSTPPSPMPMTWSAESMYHRVTVRYHESQVRPLTTSFQGLGDSEGIVESSYAFVRIQASETDVYTTILSNNFSTNPFTNGWSRFSAKNSDISVNPGTDLVTWSNGKVTFSGLDPCAWCSYDTCCNNAACCNNISAVGTPCTGYTPCGNNPNPNPTPAPPTPVATCSYNNHECNPFCDIYGFETADMWKKISTAGRKDVVVEFDLHAVSLSSVPHGKKPPKRGYGSRDSLATYTYTNYLPFGQCRSFPPLTNYINCLDCNAIEEQLMVMYTSEYSAEPYNGRTPVFDDGAGHSDGIDKWKIGRVFTRSVLREDYVITKHVRLDFSMHDETDDNPNFGLWFRGQLDSSSDAISIDNLTVIGR